MEEQQNWPELLELLERPAFTVERGRVSWVNQEALTRLVPRGQEIHALLKTGAEEYASLGNGSLCKSEIPGRALPSAVCLVVWTCSCWTKRRIWRA